MRRAVLAEDDELPPAGPPVPPWPGHAVEIGGRSIFVRETPAPGAEPALYVHGLGGSSQNWTDLAGLLQPRVDGLALDLPGFGYSDPAPRYSQRAFADCVITLIEQTDRGPVHLVGNSLGGAVSVRVAAVRPDLVRTLTLVSPAMPFLDPRRSLQGRVVPFLALPRVDRLAARQMAAIPPEQLATEVLRACFANPDAIPPQRLAEAVTEARRRSEVQHFASAYTGAMRGLVLSFLRAQLPGPGSLWAMARRITVPTLVIAGLRDRLVDVRAVSRVARAIPDTRLLLLPDVGHVAQMEVPRVVARAILGLFASASSQASASSASLAASPSASSAQDAG
ncbi:MAG: alpha/beta hydrolase [Hamadaea sp.]|uniref:alpha/beta fold hydrolase n=1 Tax=Hamadaea sp. TaxID=2024425 RepID=UPI0018332878|nr:alpha/beta hydrolase [Hamadaea sp.]NUR70562.1 alpha/beta hydrolase [Hamadaea sp.]NUT19309.1 alpha/beta hydrolase [Hamadaea sp.]